MSEFKDKRAEITDLIDECNSKKIAAAIKLGVLDKEAIGSVQTNITPGGVVFTRKDGLAIFLPDREDGQPHVMPATDGMFCAQLVWLDSGDLAVYITGRVDDIKFWLAMY